MRDALGAGGIDAGASETHIIPLVVGDAREAMAACERALRRGVFAQAIRPPTVPEGSSRLRLAAMSAHTPAELEWAAAQLGAAAREAGDEPSRLDPGRASARFLYDAEQDEPAFE